MNELYRNIHIALVYMRADIIAILKNNKPKPHRRKSPYAIFQRRSSCFVSEPCCNSQNKEKLLLSIHSLKGMLQQFHEDENTFSEIMTLSLDQTEYLINTENYEQAYDLIDAVHCLPEILVTAGRDMDSYWNSHISKYQHKWNTNIFDELKEQILRL